MREKKLLFLTVQQFVLATYFMLTTVIYYLAIIVGNEGVTLLSGGDDGSFYWIQVQNIVDGHEATLTSIYPLIIGFLIKYIGIENVYIIRIFNYFGFVLLIVCATHLVKILFKNESLKIEYFYSAKIHLLLCFLCYASLQMNVNLSIYRDIWIYTFYVFSTIASIKLLFFKKNRIINLILLIISMWILAGFRKYALLSFILTIVIYYLYKIVKRFNLLVIMIVTIALSGIYYTLLMDFEVPIVNMSLREALNYRNYFLGGAAGGSQMWIKLDQPFFGMFLIKYLYSYIGNLLGPLPWQINGIGTLFVFIVETIPMFFIVLFIWWKRKKISKLHGYILLHAFVWISLIAVTNDNLGTATRLRPVGWILILIVFVVLHSKVKIYKSQIRRE